MGAKTFTVGKRDISPHECPLPEAADVQMRDKLELVSWNDAIELAARRLKEIADKYGPESIGMLCCGKILNEEAYLSQKFQRAVIGNNHVDNCARSIPRPGCRP